MAFSKELLDEILKDYPGPDDFYGPQGIVKQLTKAPVERTREAELTGHLGYEKHDQGEKTLTNRRNGKISRVTDEVTEVVGEWRSLPKSGIPNTR
jgi:transposase-like protein